MGQRKGKIARRLALSETAWQAALSPGKNGVSRPHLFYKIPFSLDPLRDALHPVRVKLTPKAHLLAAAACLAFPMPAHLTAADAPPEKTNDIQIQSVLQRGDTLIAVTERGILEANLKQKTWRALGTPSAMPPHGKLFQQSADSPVIYYFRAWYPERIRNTTPETPAFLAISKDAGMTWKNIPLKDRHITNFCPGEKGTLFAIESSQTRPPHSMRGEGTLLLASQDTGISWKDISGDFQDDYEYLGQSLRQPGKIFVTAAAGIGYVDGFLIDEKTCEVQPNEHSVWLYEHGDDAHNPGLHTASRTYGDAIHATIANFFRYPFLQSGNDLTVDVVQVQTEKSAYTFRRDGPKIIHVKVVMLEDRPAAKFADFEDERLFWGLHMVMGNERDDVQFPPLTFLKLGEGKVFKPGQTFDEPKNAYNPLMDDTGMKTVTLDIRHPYERDIDLTKFFDFAETREPNFVKKPNFKIQLFHSDTGVIRHGGAFNSEIIDVTITP